MNIGEGKAYTPSDEAKRMEDMVPDETDQDQLKSKPAENNTSEDIEKEKSDPDYL